FCVETTLPITRARIMTASQLDGPSSCGDLLLTRSDVHRINNANYSTIGRHFNGSKRKGRLSAPTPENQFALPCPDRIDRNQGLSRVRKATIHRLYNQDLAAFQRAAFHRTDDRTYDAGQVHIQIHNTAPARAGC